jgi:integrase
MNSPSSTDSSTQLVDAPVPPSAERGLANAKQMTPADLDELRKRYLAAGTAENTRRAYRSGVHHYLAWGGLLPATPTEVANYLVSYAADLNPRTLSQRVAALARWHRSQDLPDPTTSDTVKKTIAGIRREHGRLPKKARALTVRELQAIVAHLAPQETLAAKRDAALLQIGFFGGFRRSELVGLERAFVTFEPEGLVITLRKSKTDQEGKGKKKAIPYGKGGGCCAVRALRTWLTAAGIQEGPLFRAINRWGKVRADRLSDRSVNDILERRAHLAGLEFIPEMSSHSLRRGMATSAHRAGADRRKIQAQGGWVDERTVQGYIDETGLFEDNAVAPLLEQ